MSYRRHAGGAIAAIDLAGADSATAVGFEVGMVAQPRNVDAGGVAGFDDGLSFDASTSIRLS